MATPRWAQSEREIELSGVITMTSGKTVNVLKENIASYSISDNTSASGLNIGGVCSASFTLSFFNSDKRYTPSQFDNAEVHMRIRIGTDYAEDFGVWYVESAESPEQSVLITLHGSDALKTKFEAEYIDKAVYPQTFAQILTSVSLLGLGIAPARQDFPNAALRKTNKPDWGEGCTLRQVIGYIAACAGGFAHINRSGQLDIISYIDTGEWELGPDIYHSATLTGGEKFKFNCLQIRFGDDDDYTRFAANPQLTDKPTNCIQVEGNPIITSLVGTNLATELARLPEYEALEVTWGGDPSVMPGDTITVTDLKGETHIMRVLNQSFTYNGGFRVTESCDLPAVTQNGTSYITAGRTFDANGNIRATKVSGLAKSVVNATTAHFNQLTADTVNADKLFASIIEAVSLKAQNISADEVTTDKLTAATADILNATIRKLTAGTIETDELYAAIADITAAKIGSLTADSITTDRLAAALATFTVVTAGSANFDRETVRHLIANILQVEDAVGENVTIKNLSVDYANMVTAYVGNLILKGEDGKFYRLTVGDDGEITAVEQSVSEEEENMGQTDTGLPIIETNMTVSQMSASDIKATYALINRIDAARIDVDTLTARKAFIDTLMTLELVSNSSISAYITNADTKLDDLGAWREEVSRWLTFDESGLKQGKDGSIYSTLIDERGFHIDKEGTVGHVGSFDAEGLTTTGVRMGKIICKKTTRGGWAWQEVSE